MKNTHPLPSEICRRGLFRRAKAWLLEERWKALNQTERGWCLYALYFAGDWQDAEYFREIWFEAGRLTSQAQVFFARSVARVRVGELRRARVEWVQTYRQYAKEMHHYADRFQRGWYLQAQAFFAMQQSRWASAERWAARAAELSLQGSDLILRSIAFDMRAHASVRLGSYSAALRFAQQGLACARTLGNVSIENAIRVSLVCWESERGTHPHRSLRSLRSLLKEKSFHDTHSQAVLLLELARVLSLLGEFTQARQCLVRIERTLAQADAQTPFRQRILLVQRKALLARLQGESERAVVMLESVFSEIPVFEKSLQLEVRGQMISSAREAGLKVPESWLQEEESLTFSVGTQRARRMLQRRQGTVSALADPLDDPLAGCVDQLVSAHMQRSAQRELLERGFCGLLVPRRQRPHENVLYMLPGGYDLLLHTPRHVRQLSGKPTPHMMALMRCIAMRSMSKEEIFRTIWQRRYFPERDDANVYVLVRRLRIWLGTERHLVESHNGFYRLQAWFENLAPEPDHVVSSTVFPQSRHTSPSPDSSELQIPHLRVQQLKELLEQRPSLTSDEWQSLAGISRATACRDLSYCCRMGWLQQVGRGRASVYVRLKSNSAVQSS